VFLIDLLIGARMFAATHIISASTSSFSIHWDADWKTEGECGWQEAAKSLAISPRLCRESAWRCLRRKGWFQQSTEPRAV